MDAVTKHEWVELTSRQLSIWLELQASGGSSGYQVGGYIRVPQAIDPILFSQAVEITMLRHEALMLEIDSREPRQRLAPTLEVPLDVVDLSKERDPESAFLALADDLFTQPLSLTNGPLFRVTLARLADDLWYSLLRCHHLIVDGLSIPNLTRAISETYTALVRKGDLQNIAGSTYLDFAAEDALYRLSNRATKDLDYWRDRFRVLPPRVFAPLQSQDEPVGPASSALLRWELPRERYEAFLETCNANGVRALPALLGLAGVMVQQLAETSDVCVGIAVPGRGRGALSKIGMFNGAMPVRMTIDSTGSLKTAAAHAGEQVARDYAHQRTSIDAICRLAEVAKKGRRGVFGVFLSYLPAELTNYDFELDGVPLEPTILRSHEANPLAIYVSENNKNRPILVEFAFNPSFMTRAEAELLLARFQSLFERFVTAPEAPIAELGLFDGEERRRIRGAALTAPVEEAPVLRVIASFTAEPLESGLRYWGRKLGINWAVDFAPYSQLFQELLDPTSAARTNTRGANLVLLRVEDWLRYRPASDNGQSEQGFLHETATNFGEALRAAATGSKVPTVVMICAPSAEWEGAGANAALQAEAEDILRHAAAGLPTLSLLTYNDCRKIYPVDGEFDAESDRLGHVPYTPQAYAALATFLSRRVHLALRRPYKVIVVDCDNTLWGGVVGEDGVDGIRLDHCHLDLQRRLVEASQAGLLVCLCSKNIEEDVLAVFERRSDMVLKLEHVVSHRVNWQPKSQNIHSLAAELELGLDSFVFVDDNPIEIAEVGAGCKGVATILCTHTGTDDVSFAQHVWPLDAVASTAEDAKRTRMYRENASRFKLRDQSGDYANFIKSLDLKIRVEVPADENLARSAQLTERTNQFNINGIQRSVADVRAARTTPGTAIRAIFVEDRFGDYGLVGLLMARADGRALSVENLLMSCRVLGRGVEHAMIAEFGKVADEFGLDEVRIRVRHTDRNLPVRQFLATLPGVRTADGDDMVLTLSRAEALGCAFDPGAFEAKEQDEEAPAEDAAADPAKATAKAAPRSLCPPLEGTVWAEIAENLAGVSAIADAIHEAAKDAARGIRAVASDYKAPTTRLEGDLCEYAARLLSLERVGVDDDLFELGLNSLLAVQLVAHVRSRCDVDVPIRTLFENRTIGQLVAFAGTGGEGYSALVPLQTGDNGPPLFCVHAANGDAVSFMRLAKALGGEQTVYGLEARGLAPGEEVMTSVEEMAEAYIAEIRKVRPHGPYHLLGWSFGGPVAYEMATRLKKAGEEIALLAFMDCPTPFGQDEPDLTFDDVLRILASDLESIERKFDVPLNAWANTERKVTIEEVIATAQRMGVAPPEYSVPEAKRKISVHVNCVSLFRRWKPPAYDGPILQFRATKQDQVIPYKWDLYTSGKVKTIKVRCNHIRIGFEPFVYIVADHVREHMRGTKARSAWLSRLLGVNWVRYAPRFAQAR